MSEKAVGITRQVLNEDDDLEEPVDMTVSVDFMYRDNVYLAVGGKSYAIPNQAWRDYAAFVKDNGRG
jgi:hypothetical protein